MGLISVYIKINSKNEIVAVGSNIFIKDTTNWIKIDEGAGNKYAHAQSQYFPKPLVTRRGKFNYRYENGVILEVNNENNW